MSERAPHVVILAGPNEAVDLAVERVRERVRLGGHDVPTETIVRRYARGMRNFLDLYRPLARTWRLLDNSATSPRLIARGGERSAESIHDPDAWQRFLEAAR